MYGGLDAPTLRAIVAGTERLLPDDAWPAWTLSTHDTSRFPTRWCGDDPALVRCALTLLTTLRGTPVLYYGDELGMPDTDVPDDRRRDPVTIALHRVIDRDAARTPMPWSDAPGAGFTEPGVEPWLPFGDVAACSVAQQRGDHGSVLHLVRDLLALRREVDDLRAGAYADLGASDDERPVWSFRRGETVQVVLHLGDDTVDVPVAIGPARVALTTDRRGEGEVVKGSVAVGARRGVVLVATAVESA